MNTGEVQQGRVDPNEFTKREQIQLAWTLLAQHTNSGRQYDEDLVEGAKVVLRDALGVAK